MGVRFVLLKSKELLKSKLLKSKFHCTRHRFGCLPGMRMMKHLCVRCTGKLTTLALNGFEAEMTQAFDFTRFAQG